MTFDFKKNRKDLFGAGKKPETVNPGMINYLSFEGKGNPNDENGEYKDVVEALYSVSYALRMSYKGNYKIEGFFEYVVPPLEGLWWQEGVNGYDMERKDDFSWISVIMLPDFIKDEDVQWAKEEVRKKNPEIRTDRIKKITMDEGMCVQILHVGSYDTERESVKKIETYMKENNLASDFSDVRRHHEIYLSDPRRTIPEKYRTIIRHPVKG